MVAALDVFLIALAAVAILFAVLRRPTRFVISAIIFALSVRTTMTIAVFGTPRETLIAALLAIAGTIFLIFRHRRIGRAWLLGPWFLYVVYNLPFSIWLMANGRIPYLWVAWLLTPGVMYLVVIEGTTSLRTALTLRRVLAGIGIVNVALALCAFVQSDGLTTLAEQVSSGQFDAEALRFNAWRFYGEGPDLNPWLLWVNGFFEHGASLALFCALLAPQVIWLARFDPNRRLRRLFALESVALMAMVGFSFERGVWIALVVGLLTMAVLAPKGRVLFMRTAIVVALLLCIPQVRSSVIARLQSGGTVNARMNIYGPALDVWSRSRLFGIGFGDFNNAVSIPGTTPINPHNDYLLHLAETGVIGLSVYVGVFVMAWLSLTKARRLASTPYSRNSAATGMATVAIFMTHVAAAPGQVCLDMLLIILAVTEAHVRLSLRAERAASLPSPDQDAWARSRVHAVRA